MLKLFKIAGAVLIAGALLFAVCLVALYHLIQAGELRQLLVSEFEERTGAKVNVGEVDLAFGSVLEATFREFVLSRPDIETPFMTAERVTVRLALAPLLERRFVFHEVRFSHPLLRLEKDETDNLPALALLSHLFLPSETREKLQLDLREINIEKGEIVVRDPKHLPDSIVLQLRETDLRLRRISSAPGDSSGSEPAAPRANEKKGLGLDFSLQTGIQKDKDFARLSSKGKIHSAESDFNIQRAWLDFDLTADEIPAQLLWDYLDFLPRAKAVGGMITTRARWQGSLHERGRVQGKIDFKQLAIAAPEFLTQQAAPGDGQVEFELEWTPKEIRIPRWDFRSQELSFAAQGVSISRAQDEPTLDGQFQTPFLPLPVVKKYFPRPLLESPRWGEWLRGWNQGELRLVRGRIKGLPSDLRRLSKPGLEDSLELDLELKGAGGTAPQSHRLPLKDVKGHLVLEKGVLYYRGLSGTYGQSRLTELNGSQKGVFAGQPLLELRLNAEIALQELYEGLPQRVLPAQLARNTGFLKESAGRGQLKLFLRTDFDSRHHFEGQLLLDQARLRIGDLVLTQLKGNLVFSPKEAHADRATALLSGSPVTIRLVLKDYMTEKGSFDLAVESPGAKAGLVTRLLLSMGSFDDPGTARGSIRYQGPMGSDQGRKLTGSLEFSGAQLSFLRDRVRDLSGQLLLNGDSIDFRGVKGRLAGTDFDFSGQWREEAKPQLVFSLHLQETDLGGLLSQIDNESAAWYPRLQAKGRVTAGKGRYEGFQFSDLATDLLLENRLWRLENFSARSASGTIQGRGYFFDQPQGVRFSVAPKIHKVPVEEFLRWFDVGSAELSGRINLAGTLESSGKKGPERKRNLNGDFRLEIEDGTVRRFRLLVLIMNFLDLSRWFTLQIPDINQKGIRFRSITGDFKVSQGVYSTQNLFVDSDDLRITGAGRVDGPKGELDFVIAIRPFPRLDTAVNIIPLIGPGIAAIKNSFLVASFRLTGSVENPSIVPAPLSTLSEFFYGALAIPRSIIGLPPEEKK